MTQREVRVRIKRRPPPRSKSPPGQVKSPEDDRAGLERLLSRNPAPKPKPGSKDR
jgi:hypothetical protein